MAERPRLLKVDPEMQRWCAVIEDELSTWPDVTCKPMFGLAGYYRGRDIFAAIPRTRAMGTPFSLLIKRPGARAARLTATRRGPGAGWVAFAMESESDIGEALRQLGRAYERAGKANAQPRRGVRR